MTGSYLVSISGESVDSVAVFAIVVEADYSICERYSRLIGLSIAVVLSWVGLSLNPHPLTPEGAAPKSLLEMEFKSVGGVGVGFDVEVVDQAGFAEEGGQEDVRAAPDADYWLEGVGVDNFGVVESGARFGGEDFLHGGLDGEGVAGAGGEFVAGGGQGGIEEDVA